MTLVSTVGGASGPLYGTFFLRFGSGSRREPTSDAAAIGAALRAGVEGIVARGKAELGDKTMYDAWAPALEAYDAAAGEGLPRGLRRRRPQQQPQGRGRGDRLGRSQGSGQLPRRAQRRSPGPGCHQHHAAARGCGDRTRRDRHRRRLAQPGAGGGGRRAGARDGRRRDRTAIVEVAAGLDETTFGTDATAVAEAIEQRRQPRRRAGAARPGQRGAERRDGAGVRRPRGGRARHALERAARRGPGRRGRAGCDRGARVDAVAAEAQQGLLGKQDHLGDAAATGGFAAGRYRRSSARPDASAVVNVTNAARPARPPGRRGWCRCRVVRRQTSC